MDIFRWYHEANIALSRRLGTEYELERLNSKMPHRGRSHNVQTLFAVENHKDYDSVTHRAILEVLRSLLVAAKVHSLGILVQKIIFSKNRRG